MNKVSLLLVLIAGMLFSCSPGQKDKVNQEDKPIETPITGQQEEVIIPSDSGLVKLNIADGKGTVQIRKKESQTIYIEFPVEGYKRLSARLSSSDSTANVRFSQIFMPDGKMDGPWGINMEYDLPMDGTYKLSVHENMMAGDPWSGIFKVEVDLAK